MVVKAFGAETVRIGTLPRGGERLLKTNVRYVRSRRLSSPMIEMLAAVTIVGLLYYARQRSVATRSPPAGFSTFILALMMLLEPVKRLAGIHNIFQQALGASQKVFEYLDHTEEMSETAGRA